MCPRLIQCGALVLTLFVAPTLRAQDGTAKLPAGLRLLRILSAKKPFLDQQIHFARQGKELIATSDDGVHAFAVDSGELQHSWPGSIQGTAVSADGDRLAVIDQIGQITIVDLTTRKPKQTFRFETKKQSRAETTWPNDTAALAFSGDGKLLAAGLHGYVESWELESGKRLHTYPRPFGIRFGMVRFLPDNERILVAGFPAIDAMIWNGKTGKEDEVVYMYKYVRCAHLSGDGKLLAAGMNLFSSSLLLVGPDWREKSFARLQDPPLAVALAPDKRMIAVACKKSMLLMHTRSLQRVDEFEFKGTQNSLAFSPDGSQLAATGADGKIRICNVVDWRKKLDGYDKLTPARLEEQWALLSEENDEYGHRSDDAMRLLVSVPDQAVPFFAKKLKPAQAPDPVRVARLIADLESPKFETRDAANRELQRLGWLVKSSLRKASEVTASLEGKRRIEALLDAMASPYTPEHRQIYNAVWTLWKIRTPAALDLLRFFAKGAPDAFLTLEARKTVEYMDAKKAK